MGARANVRFKEAAGSIYLYSHWAGYELAEQAKAALLKAESRWTDPSYCTRYIISQCTKDIADSVTGGGVSIQRTDNEYAVLEIDYTKKKCRLLSDAGWHNDPNWEQNAAVLKEWTFKEFVCDPSEVHAITKTIA